MQFAPDAMNYFKIFRVWRKVALPHEGISSKVPKSEKTRVWLHDHPTAVM